MSATRRCRRREWWSDLQGELLEMVLEKLDLVDHARFASVCSSWRSIAVKNPPINKPLYMALSHDPKHLVRRFITSFLPSWNEARFIGALDGWLVILVDDLNLFLFNKGLNSIVPLPPPPEDPKYLPELCKAVLSSPPSSAPSTSSVECTVAIKHFDAGVFYCRLGSDKSFTKLSSIPNWPQDILFYKGRLYVLCRPNTIVIFDHLLNKVSRFRLVQGPVTISTLTPARLLISENKILVVAERPNWGFVLTVNGNVPRAVLLKNIDDNLLLLVNRYCSLSFRSTEEHKEFRRTNYFDDDFSTFVMDTSKYPNNAKVDDPWPLFFVMFRHSGIKRFRAS